MTRNDCNNGNGRDDSINADKGAAWRQARFKALEQVIFYVLFHIK